MHKNATKCNETLSKWCKNKYGASKIIDTFETYQQPSLIPFKGGSTQVTQTHNLSILLESRGRDSF
jgi:hypothetical protein